MGDILAMAFPILLAISVILGGSVVMSPDRAPKELQILSHISSLLPGALLGWNLASWPSNTASSFISGLVSWGAIQTGIFLFSLPYRNTKQ